MFFFISMITNYFYISIFFLLSFGLSVLIFILATNLSNYQSTDLEKLSSYECGFDPFEEARQKFDVRFYLVAILFLVFDLEISFLFPWSVSFFFVRVFIEAYVYFFVCSYSWFRLRVA